MQVLLSVELGETSPRQRTLLRRAMIQQGWSLLGDGLMFSSQIQNIESDEQAITQVTEQLHFALKVAEIEDWGADCFVKSKIGVDKNRELTSS